MTWRETLEWQTESTQPREKSEIDNPYWRLETLPVNDPDGKPLGHALHILVYPGLERESEQNVLDNEPFRMLEIAHFETTEVADKFIEAFNGYLMPGLLEGPELAEEVARLEGLPIAWKTPEDDDLKAYQNAELTLTRDPADWHLYNPNAEQDTRIETEGLHVIPSRQFVSLDEGDSDVTSVAPDLDL